MKITLITSCTNRKRFPVDPELQLRNVRGGELKSRFQSWTQRLEERNGPVHKVEEMYSGEHWYVARKIERNCRESDVDLDLYICSGGYGLLSPENEIKPYSVTFTGGFADSVSSGHSRNNDNQQWWKLLNSWEYNGTDKLRSITQLIKEKPDRTFVIALSNVYLRTIYNDLLEARSFINDPDNLIIVSAGTAILEELTDNLLNVDARFEQQFQCARTTLNIHIANHLIENLDKVPIGLKSSKKYFHSLWRTLKPPQTYNRMTKTDEEIKALIKEMIDKNLGVKPSPLLRMLRDNKIACEQKRFSKLFYEVRNG